MPVSPKEMLIPVEEIARITDLIDEALLTFQKGGQAYTVKIYESIMPEIQRIIVDAYLKAGWSKVEVKSEYLETSDLPVEYTSIRLYMPTYR